MSRKRKAPARVVAVIERRRSGAAGTHDKSYNRSGERRAAIREQEG